jgi:uncharacterized membrane protein YgaE (UPF0421/DUF939 family)
MNEKNLSYMNLMDIFFAKCEEITKNSTNTQIIEILQKNKTLIKEIAALAKETTLFKKSQKEYELFKFNMFQKKELEEQIIFAYTQLMGKIANAPTYLHMNS